MITKLSDLLESGKELLFVGVGNLLKKDDGIGVYIVENICEKPTRKTLLVEMSIEKYMGTIERIAPEVLVLVDAMDTGKLPGQCALIPAPETPDQTSHTHNISLRRVSEFFEMPVFILGVQPYDLTYGEGFSPDVLSGAEKIITLINNN